MTVGGGRTGPFGTSLPEPRVLRPEEQGLGDVLINSAQAMVLLGCGVGRLRELVDGCALEVMGEATNGMWLFSLNEVERLRGRLLRARGLRSETELANTRPLARREASDPSLAEGAAYNWETWTLSIGDTPINLTKVESLIFRELARNAGRLVLVDTLVNQVWGASYERGRAVQTLRSNVTRMRGKLRAAGANPHRLLRNRPGLGYILTTE